MKEDQLQEGRGNSLFTLKNLIILLIGFALGYLIKVQVRPYITMGYDDYKISQWQSNVKANEDKKNTEQIEKQNMQPVQNNEQEQDNKK